MRPIDADALYEIVNERAEQLIREYSIYDHYTHGFSDVLDYIEDAPTIDAVPVVHGKWKYIYYRSDVIGRKCSICSGICGKDWNFCPNCGAKMDLEDK